MIEFDSDEYWQIKTWDRFRELEAVPPPVRQEFLRQERTTVQRIRSLPVARVPLRILDLACGTGCIVYAILQALPVPPHVTLVDFNNHTLDQARAYLGHRPNLTFRCVNAYQIRREFEEQFDVVVCLDFLHHVSQPGPLPSQINHVLKPSGILVANVLAAGTYAEWDRTKYGILKSSRRHLLNTLSKRVYKSSPRPIRKGIRRFGLARIEPISKRELIQSLAPHFQDFEFITTYYHWFSATKPSG